MMLTRKIACLALVALSCAGCVVVPIPRNDPDVNSSRAKIEKQTVESLRVGTTTLQDVLLMLGEPEEHYESPTVLFYRWRRIKGLFLFLCCGGPYGFGAFDREDRVDYTLRLTFDDDGKLRESNVSEVIFSIRQSRWPRL